MSLAAIRARNLSIQHLQRIARLRGQGFPTAALDIDFTRSLAYGTSLSALSVTRASVGYAQTNAGNLQSFAANVARITDKGLLVEEARANICLQSQTFGTTWAVVRSTISSDAATAPDGTLTADKLVDDGTAGTHLTRQSVTKAASSLQYTFTVYAKPDGRSRLRILLSDSGETNGVSAVFDLSGAQIGVAAAAIGAGWTSGGASIQAASNGWVRCTLIATSDTTTVIRAGLYNDSGSGTAAASISYTGDSASGVYLWGAQIEQAAFATSYIPTTSASATRAADVVRLFTTAIPGFSATEGTLYAEGGPSYASTGASIFPTLASLDDYVGAASNNERVTLYRSDATSGGAGRMVVTDGGANQAVMSAAVTWTDSASHKLAGAFAANDFILCDNGTLATPDTAGTMPLMTALGIGCLGNSSQTNGYLKRVAYWPTRLANATLQALTT